MKIFACAEAWVLPHERLRCRQIGRPEDIMGSFSIWHWLVVLGVALLLFGGGNKLSSLMGDFAKGIKSFKKNMGDETPDASMEAAAEQKPGTTTAGGNITGPSAQAAPTVGQTTTANRG